MAFFQETSDRNADLLRIGLGLERLRREGAGDQDGGSFEKWTGKMLHSRKKGLTRLADFGLESKVSGGRSFVIVGGETTKVAEHSKIADSPSRCSFRSLRRRMRIDLSMVTCAASAR